MGNQYDFRSFSFAASLGEHVMAHQDGRLDPQKKEEKREDSGRVKDGVSGNVTGKATLEHERAVVNESERRHQAPPHDGGSRPKPIDKSRQWTLD
jgi:hypothetical protein